MVEPLDEGVEPVGEGVVSLGDGVVPLGEGPVPPGEVVVPPAEAVVPLREGLVLPKLLFGDNSIAAGDSGGTSGVPGDSGGDDGRDIGDAEGDLRSGELSSCVPGAVELPKPAPEVLLAVAGLMPAVVPLAPEPLPSVAPGEFGLLALLEAPLLAGLLAGVAPLADELEPAEPTQLVKTEHEQDMASAHLLWRPSKMYDLRL